MVDSVAVQGEFTAAESFGDYHCIAAKLTHSYSHQALDQVVYIYKEFDGKALVQEIALTFDSKVERLMSYQDSLYVQVVGTLYKISLPIKPLTQDNLTQEERKNKFSVLRVEHNKFGTGD